MCSFLLCCCCFNSFTAYLGMQFKGKPRGGTQSSPSSDHITQVAKKLWGLLFGDLQKPPDHRLGPSALGVPAGAGVGQMAKRSLPASATLVFCFCAWLLYMPACARECITPLHHVQSTCNRKKSFEHTHLGVLCSEPDNLLHHPCLCVRGQNTYSRKLVTAFDLSSKSSAENFS